MSQLVDRRLSGKNRSAVNRQRFLRRFKGQIGKAVTEAVSGRKVSDLERGEKISIPSKDLSEPVFHHGSGGKRTGVHPGNKEFVRGDKVDRPEGGGGEGGGSASQDGEAMDEFVFELSKEEFMDFFFQDLALPDLVKKQLTAVPEVKKSRAGFVSQGNPSNLHVVRSMKQAIGRRLALAAGPREALLEAQEELAELEEKGLGASPEADALREEIESLKARIAAVPFIDTWDLRYANRVDHPIPSSQAVMFCLMDVSGSMDENRKNIAKRFFMLLYLFLTKSYERIEVVFIRHHTVAKEVDEEDFFSSRESGGTVVSSALTLMREIVLERYSSANWNIYAAQASDGDNWEEDSPRCRELLVEGILPLVQYFAYVEIEAREPQSLWHEYEAVKAISKRFAIQRILSLEDIYPVFRELFKKKVTEMEETPTVVAPERQPLSVDAEWTFELLDLYDREIGRVAAHYGLDTYPRQIEIITSEQMIDAYSSVGMPLGYHHWSYGKEFLSTQKSYKRGQMGLAYEIVINSSPCIAYLMEENTMTMQALVIAHAAYGHNSFFKGNYLFRTWTDAEGILDYLVFARNFIAECEQRHGEVAVEELLDSCHALMNYGVDRYKRPAKLSMAKEQARQMEREAYLQSQVSDLWRTLPPKQSESRQGQAARYPAEPQENLLYFIEKNAPRLEPWQREIVRIVRKIAQYFYPQRQTQVMNEGWATFWHYTLLNHLYEEGKLTDGFMMEFLQSHTNVVYQPPYYSHGYSGINPYALGFAMFQDLRRICEHPTDEDRHWFPDLAGSDWVKTLGFAMRNFKDESFIAQYLSPKLIRDLKLFSLVDDDSQDKIEITAIHDEAGYRQVRQMLAEQYNLGNREPNIQVYNVDFYGNRSLTLHHYMHNRRPLGASTNEVLRHIARLWGYTVRIESVDETGRARLVSLCEV